MSVSHPASGCLPYADVRPKGSGLVSTPQKNECHQLMMACRLTPTHITITSNPARVSLTWHVDFARLENSHRGLLLFVLRGEKGSACQRFSHVLARPGTEESDEFTSNINFKVPLSGFPNCLRRISSHRAGRSENDIDVGEARQVPDPSSCLRPCILDQWTADGWCDPKPTNMWEGALHLFLIKKQWMLNDAAQSPAGPLLKAPVRSVRQESGGAKTTRNGAFVALWFS